MGGHEVRERRRDRRQRLERPGAGRQIGRRAQCPDVLQSLPKHEDTADRIEIQPVLPQVGEIERAGSDDRRDDHVFVAVTRRRQRPVGDGAVGRAQENLADGIVSAGTLARERTADVTADPLVGVLGRVVHVVQHVAEEFGAVLQVQDVLAVLLRVRRGPIDHERAGIAGARLRCRRRFEVVPVLPHPPADDRGIGERLDLRPCGAADGIREGARGVPRIRARPPAVDEIVIVAGVERGAAEGDVAVGERQELGRVVGVRRSRRIERAVDRVIQNRASCQVDF